VVALCAVLVLLNAADLFTTIVGRDQGRHESMLAPLMAVALASGSGSLLPAIGLKVVSVVLVCAIVRLGWWLTGGADASDAAQARTVLTCFVGVACAITLVVVVLNLLTLLT
jgi:hypothetical protein